LGHCSKLRSKPTVYKYLRMQPRNRTRRASPSPATTGGSEPSNYGANQNLENFLNLNASEAYKRPWHRLERGLRLNRLRKFIDSESSRMNLAEGDRDMLTNILHRALDMKLLNSKTAVIYDQATEEIQEIKGLIYHKTADGRILSKIVEKKTGVTLRRKKIDESAQTNSATTNQTTTNGDT
jgi:hypothetical protein